MNVAGHKASWRALPRGVGTGVLRVTVLIALAFAAAFQPRASQAQDSFYSGKSLRLIVGMPPGGGVDSYARLVQRHLGRLIAGKPNIIVQNMPGAGSLRSVLALANAAPDGTTLVTFSSSLIFEAVVEPQRTRVDFRDFAFLGNVSEDVRVCFVRKELGLKSFADVKRRPQVVFGSTAPGTSGNIDTAVLQNIFGIRLKQVQGYEGSAAKRIALESGEIDGDCGGWTSLPPDWLTSNRVDVFVRLSPTLLSGMSGAVPYGGELVRESDERQLYDLLTSPERIGRPFMVSKAVPADRINVLRAAFDAMMVDPEFTAEAKAMRLSLTPMSGAAVEDVIAGLYKTPADLIARAKQITQEP